MVVVGIRIEGVTWPIRPVNDVADRAAEGKESKGGRGFVDLLLAAP